MTDTPTKPLKKKSSDFRKRLVADRICNAWMDEPIKAERWINLYIYEGKYKKGKGVWPTEQEAKNRAKQFLDEVFDGVREGKILGMQPDGEVTNLKGWGRHAIQIPVK